MLFVCLFTPGVTEEQYDNSTDHNPFNWPYLACTMDATMLSSMLLSMLSSCNMKTYMATKQMTIFNFAIYLK